MTESGFFLNVAKPAGVTSRDVVNRLVRLIGEKRIGHAGTLDPAAQGVLVVAVGTATRLVEYVQRLPKRYLADVRLGETSDTDDAEGSVVARPASTEITKEQVRAALALFVGEIQQTPPAYSAVKIAGKRAYRMAREGELVDLKSRPVTVHSIELLDYCYPEIRLDVRCGSGVYIRSIARDLGAALGLGGLLARLVRTEIGPFTLESAASLESLDRDGWESKRLPLLAGVSGLPRIVVDELNANRFRWGQWFPAVIASSTVSEAVVVDPSGRFLGIAAVDHVLGQCRACKGGFLIEASAATPASSN